MLVGGHDPRVGGFADVNIQSSHRLVMQFGGAISAEPLAGSVTIEEVTIDDSSAVVSGGAVFVDIGYAGCCCPAGHPLA